MDFKNLTAPVSLARKTSHYIYEGMSYTADVREGVQWSTLAEAAEGPKLALRFIAPAPAGQADSALTLVAPRFLYDGGRLLAEAEVVQAHLHGPELLLSRTDAQRLGLASGDRASVSHNGTTVIVPVKIDRAAADGVALIPRNLAGRPAEKLVGPEGLYTTVTVEKI
jgi:anaerobic selenocysteine-containing dehydrogenase